MTTVDPTAEPAVRLAQRLRQLREQAGMTAKELGLKVRMHREGVERLERTGHAGELPSVRTILRFADALDIEPSEILCVLDQRWALAESWKRDRIARGQRVAAGDVERYDPMQLTRVLAERQGEEGAA